MEFDQSFNAAPLDWNFPSPNQTPSTSPFGDNAFQTPKASSFPTHFQDAFRTPQMPTYSTPQQMHSSSMTPLQRPQSSSETLRSNYYANIHAAGSQSGGQSMAPPIQVGHNGSMVSPTYSSTSATSMHFPISASFDSSQMRTPPPTRGTSSRKPQPQQIAFGTPSTIASRRFMTPQQPLVSNDDVPLAHQTPVQFPPLEFSSDMYQFANIGPASAPVMPQSRILWASSSSPMQPVPPTAMDDPFAPAGSNEIGWLTAAPQLPNVQTVDFNTPAMDSFPIHAPHPRTAPASQTSNTHILPSTTEPTGVDPSLLYSSPVKPMLRSDSRTKKARSSMAASENQVHDYSTSTHNRSDTIASADTVVDRSISNLRRSNTTGATRPKRMNLSVGAVESYTRSNSTKEVPRTASPVKRYGGPSLGSISESRPRQRTSVILTVDENGRARTETKRVEPSPTRSIRERYPALFDSDSSDGESDAPEQMASRPSSFIFEKREERRAKAAKLDPPVENLEGLSIPRSNSSTSMRKGVPPSRAAVAAAAQLRRQSSLRRSTPSRNQNRKSFMSSSATSLIDTCPMDVPPSQQQSTHGAEYVADADQDGNMSWHTQEDTFEAPSHSAESALNAHNRRWSMMSFEQQQHLQSISSNQHHYQTPYFRDFAVQGPPHGHQPYPQQLLVRCPCGIPNQNGLPLIQCHSCTQWQHTPCVGLENQVLPPSFTCFLCTRPPSNRPLTNTQ